MLSKRLIAYQKRKTGLLLSARIAHDENTFNHREFRVGAAFVVESKNGEDYQIISAGNMKRPCRRKDMCHCEEGKKNGGNGHVHTPPMKARKKCCAERLAIRRAERAGYPFVVGGSIVGDEQSDDDSGVRAVFLEPCRPCRRFFWRLVKQGRMDNDAPFLLAHPNPNHKVLPIEKVFWQIMENHNESMG